MHVSMCILMYLDMYPVARRKRLRYMFHDMYHKCICD